MIDAAAELAGRVNQLEQEVERLSNEVAVLRRLIDPEGVRAVEEMRCNSASNEQLRNWSHNSTIPARVDEQTEEKPW